MKKGHLITLSFLIIAIFFTINLVFSHSWNNMIHMGLKSISNSVNFAQADFLNEKSFNAPGFEGPITITALFVFVSIVSILRKRD